MGLYEMDFVNQQQIEARWGAPYPKREPIKIIEPEIVDITPEVPCAMDRAYKDWLARGGKGTFSILLVCHCPRCSPRCTC